MMYFQACRELTPSPLKLHNYRALRSLPFQPILANAMIQLIPIQKLERCVYL